ncbi:dicarboxylate carrier UCP2-like isoform X1 [Lycorma delicatula]|uniref:dicarboxylate carrier UCP2-like isoform X1 n=1 Tax=Lycorma delicatula TaxID=130591 RepID=UPI003F5148C4
MTNTSDMPFFLRMGVYASSACFADFMTFPFDVAKVRLQVQGEKIRGAPGGAVVYRGLLGTIATVIHNEGYRSLFNGLSAGLQRQLCFSSIRFGLYDSVKNFYMSLIYGSPSTPTLQKPLSDVSPTTVVISPHSIYPTKKEEPVNHGINVPIRIAAGLTTGFMSVCVAQPTDVVKIRFQAMTKGSQRYDNTRQAYNTIFRQEGLPGLWKGTMANAVRNSIVNVAEIVVYDTVKEAIIMKGIMRDNIYCHFSTATIAGLSATFVASPVDVIKTRYMNSPKGQYKGAFDCAIKTLKKEGLFAFYKGFVPSFCRIATWNIVVWVTFEQLKSVMINSRKN